MAYVDPVVMAGEVWSCVVKVSHVAGGWWQVVVGSVTRVTETQSQRDYSVKVGCRSDI